MPTTRILKLTASNLKSLVNPTGDTELFQYGGIGQMSEQDTVDLIQDEEETTVSKLPERYCDVIRGKVPGQILTHRKLGARGGETTFSLALKPVVDGSVSVYVNFPFKRRPWSDRNYEDMLPSSAYTVDLMTGVLTLNTALTKGDSLVVEYRHDGSQVFSTIRSLVLKAARIELYTRFPAWGIENTSVTDLSEALQGEIDNFYAADGGARGINLIDEMQLVEETRSDSAKPIKMPFLGGWA